MMDISTFSSDNDPTPLSEIFRKHSNSQKALYFSGNIEVFKDRKVITIVGSRTYSQESEIILEKIIQGLAGYPIVIVSGLALGIDGLAHTLALKHNIPTVSFPGSGLGHNVLYPRSHLQLANKIVNNDGLLVSPFSTETPAAKWTFPQRNILMAQCADLVLVVEAKDSSGTLITARAAYESGISLGVIPHSPLCGTALGSNKLLQDGAYPILDHTDILRLLDIEITSKQYTKKYPQDTKEAALISLLQEPISKQSLYEKTTMDYREFSALLTKLELEGYVSERYGLVTLL